MKKNIFSTSKRNLSEFIIESKNNIADKTKKMQLQKKISDSMMSTFNSVIKKKKEYYTVNKNIYTPEDVEQIISKCGNKNAVISGGAGLVPGVWGMLVVVPEITLIIKNQIEMIYDIGKANNKTGKELSKELIVGIFSASVGTAGIGLITIHAGKVLVKRASLRVLQKIVAMMGGKVTQRLLKSMVAKWLPGVGAVAMATWAKYSTNLIGKKAQEIFSKDIIYEEGELTEFFGDLQIITNISKTVQDLIDKNKIVLLSNLMKIDGGIATEEITQITTMIKAMDFTKELSSQLLNMLGTMEQSSVDFDLLRENNESIPMLMDMHTLAYADNELHNLEKKFIRETRKKLGISVEEIDDLLEPT